MRKRFLVAIVIVLQFQQSHSQALAESDSLKGEGTLSDCIHYALLHQPRVRQSLIDEAITEHAISGKIADWYPQLNFGFNVQHDPQLPVSIVQGSPVPLGVQNTSTGAVSLSQTLFNRDVLLASSTAGAVRRASAEQTVTTKIDVVVNVSKAYYAVLVTKVQIGLLDEDITRLEQNLTDTYDQYTSGVVDKTDYQRATIALNNAQAQRLQSGELLRARYATLKTEMGYPTNANLEIEYDTTRMEQEAILDTSQSLVLDRRIEYQFLKTQRSLQEADVNYNEWGFLPSLIAYGAYNLSYQSAAFSRLFGKDYPNSNVGVQLSFPIFEGGKRIQEILGAKLALERIDYDLVSLDNTIHSEYVAAMGSYKSNLNNFRVSKENEILAKEVFNTIQLQYKAGTKTYLDVITAETDLRTAQANETDALYALLSSKLDVQKALGTIHYE